MRELMKEPRSSEYESWLYVFCLIHQQDISSLVSTGVSDDEVESDEDDNHFLSHKIDPSSLRLQELPQRRSSLVQARRCSPDPLRPEQYPREDDRGGGKSVIAEMRHRLQEYLDE